VARPSDDLAAQVEPGHFSPDYAGEQTNRGADEVLARQASAAGLGSTDHTGRKIDAAQANYLDPGPAPFQCANCRYFLHDECAIVYGPGENGAVAPEATCRFFTPNPIERAGRPMEAADAERAGGPASG